MELDRRQCSEVFGEINERNECIISGENLQLLRKQIKNVQDSSKDNLQGIKISLEQLRITIANEGVIGIPDLEMEENKITRRLKALDHNLEQQDRISSYLLADNVIIENKDLIHDILFREVRTGGIAGGLMISDEELRSINPLARNDYAYSGFVPPNPEKEKAYHDSFPNIVVPREWNKKR
jgi:hypothetical protein